MLVFGFLSATLLLSCLSGFGLLQFFLSATLLLSCLSGFGPLGFFLSATLLLSCLSGFGLLQFSLSAFCWFCWWFVFFHENKAGWRLIHPTLYGLRERGHVNFGVLQNRKPDPVINGCHVGFLEH
jgi:hypothetical protein